MDSMKRYKMRAECIGDAARAINAINEPYGSLTNVYIAHPNPMFGDVEVAFDYKLPMGVLVEKLKCVFDGHVMVRTVDFEARYTGEDLRDG